MSYLAVTLKVLPITSVAVPFTSVVAPFSSLASRFSIRFHFRVSPARVFAPQLLSVPVRPIAAGALPAATRALSAILVSAPRDALLPLLCLQRQLKH